MALKRTLLVLGTIAWIAPLSAHQDAVAVKHHSSACPYERAREAAAAAVATRSWQPPKPSRTITLTDRVPGGSVLGWGGDSGFLKP